MYTKQELIKQHIREECKYCRLSNNKCEGITFTIDNKTRCAKTEE